MLLLHFVLFCLPTCYMGFPLAIVPVGTPVGTPAAVTVGAAFAACRHFELKVTAERICSVKNCGSTNDTAVNKEPIPKKR